jgi:SAM-dependent methyltransferase
MIKQMAAKTINVILAKYGFSTIPPAPEYFSARKIVSAAKRRIKQLPIKTINAILAKYGFSISPLAFGYISARKTVSAAEREGLSVCDYVEKLWNQQGDTQRIIDNLASYGVFDLEDANILEIGTGTGRYLEKIIRKCKPAKYESYEPNRGWAEWLQSTYSIVSHKADGISLRQTPTDSIDFLHVDGVFVYLPFLIVYRYFKEIFRVVKHNGFVVFDIMSEDCFDQSTVERWLRSRHRYPCFLSTEYVVSLFESGGFILLGSFRTRSDEGYSKYLVFRRKKAL